MIKSCILFQEGDESNEDDSEQVEEVEEEEDPREGPSGLAQAPSRKSKKDPLAPGPAFDIIESLEDSMASVVGAPQRPEAYLDPHNQRLQESARKEGMSKGKDKNNLSVA